MQAPKGPAEPKGPEEPASPFAQFRISSHAPLDAIQGRAACPGCSKTRKHYCYDCLRPMNAAAEVPRVALPCEVHVVKHPLEHNSKSTGVHAPILSAARLISYSQDDGALPAYDPATTVLLFPSARSTSLQALGAKLSTVRTAVIVDCTWSQAHGILSDERLSSLPHVHIEAQKTLFWRYQKGKTEDHLATIEAVYFFCRQFHEALHGSGAPGWQRYDGRYDDLLYYYSYQYELVQRVYRERLTAAAGPEQLAAERADLESVKGVPAARLPAALSLLRRHREVDAHGDEVKRRGRAGSTLTAMGAGGDEAGDRPDRLRSREGGDDGAGGDSGDGAPAAKRRFGPGTATADD